MISTIFLVIILGHKMGGTAIEPMASMEVCNSIRSQIISRLNVESVIEHSDGYSIMCVDGGNKDYGK